MEEEAEGAWFPQQAASFLSTQQHYVCTHANTHTNMQKYTNKHTTQPADKANRKPQTAD